MDDFLLTTLSRLSVIDVEYPEQEWVFTNDTPMRLYIRAYHKLRTYQNVAKPKDLVLGPNIEKVKKKSQSERMAYFHEHGYLSCTGKEYWYWKFSKSSNIEHELSTKIRRYVIVNPQPVDLDEGQEVKVLVCDFYTLLKADSLGALPPKETYTMNLSQLLEEGSEITKVGSMTKEKRMFGREKLVFKHI